MFYVLAILATVFAAVSATQGVDVSQATSKSSFECMVSGGKSFAVVRVYQSSGHTDSNGPTTIKNAWNAGMKHVDGYIFPCYSCGNPAKQMDDTVNALKNAGAKYGMLWIDVEGTSYWSSSTSNNVNFIQGMVDEGLKKNVTLGIYTSSSQWNPITGGSTQFKKYPLWYAHYDGVSSFSDFVPFGGWTSPAIKQYKGDVSYCSAGVDYNYY
mmetsp:Transcript_22534/g.32930  ORF Transcript_22534/g.32930 Transcript_22534/m.32930 type:complete len:211 (+) Transcript_22534:39-671(+)|eukprot:CAMPEP_0185024256 /NCGR_PEP_ID=MMETSP1103-20130426/7251_1 /TAXON_ID=36769 /ORGANISM="Paraphysomonas bandaiensis, Strain Caron Lab Isolate" /LENGTH=210 /DNA_ID=CAMNT_0027557175 /DNA_START=37 /DNA_END=669 /DNA_ORIENTATION=-